MKNKFLLFLLPILALLVANYIYFQPVLSGKVLKQDDIMMGYAKGKEIRDYRENKGEEALWTNSMFSGMPAFQISTQYPGNILGYIQNALIFIGGSSSSIYIVFLLMLGMYLLLVALKVDPWLATLGAFAFGFSAFFIISFGAGHNAKVRAAAYIAPTLMGVLLTLKGRYLTGFALTALFVGLSVYANHLQITYYEAILILVILLVEAFFAFKEKTIAQFMKSAGILLAAAIVGIGPNIGNLWSTYSYTSETMRGGSSELASKAESKGGLDFDYAMGWSYSAAENFNLIVPMYTGGGMSEDYSSTETYQQFFPLIKQSFQRDGYSATQAGESAERFIGSLFYWGEESLVNGGYYLGASIFFLFILGLLAMERKMKVWIIAALAISVFMGMGRHFETFNRLLFDYLPIYNKFRVPSMSLVVVFVVIPFGAIYGLNEWLKKSNADKKRLLLNAVMGVGGLYILLFLGSGLLSFDGMRDAQLGQQGLDVDQLLADRKSLQRNSIGRSLVFSAAIAAFLWFFITDKLNKKLLIPSLAFILMADLWMFDKQHLNSDSFMTEREFKNQYAPTAADQQILQDPAIHYRVMNTTAGLTSDSYTSYHHKSIGGYHGAKLIRYQDLIENQLSKNNPKVYDMLNTKYYIIQREGNGPQAMPNPTALGNAWFVSSIKQVATADEEMAALDKEVFQPENEAIVDQRYSTYLEGLGNNSTGSTIRLKEYDPKRMVYTSENTSGQDLLAVFSEIYYEGYKNDWKVFIDGKEVEMIRVNYLLRGLRVPSGSTEIVFSFEPYTYLTGEKIDKGFSAVLLLALLGSLFFAFRKKEGESMVTES